MKNKFKIKQKNNLTLWQQAYFISFKMI